MDKPIEEQLDEVFTNCIEEDPDGNLYPNLTKAKQQILSLMLPKQKVGESIGDSEVHVSHVCPMDSISCAEFHARSEYRNAIRKELGLEL